MIIPQRPSIVERERATEHRPYSPEGIIVPIITPARMVEGQTVVDVNSINSLVRELMKCSVDGLFVLGTAGEFQRLTLGHKQETITSVIQAVKQNPVMEKPRICVGVSASTIDEMISTAVYAEQAGADALVLAPLYGDGEVEEKINRLVVNTTLPIILYNNPDIHPKKGDDGKLPIEDIRRASKNPRIVAIKDSSRSDIYLDQILRLRTDKFHVLTGNTGLLLYARNHGADGFISVLGNLFPERVVELFNMRDENIQIELERERTNYSTVVKIKEELVRRGTISSAVMFS